MYLFTILVSTAFIRTEDMTDDTWPSHKKTWYESFRDADRVYERTGGRYSPYSGLLINTETEDPIIYNPLWLFEMLEAGFISKLIITFAIQISLFPRVIQEAAAQIGGLNYMKLEIWSTLSVWDTSYLSIVKILVWKPNLFLVFLFILITLVGFTKICCYTCFKLYKKCYKMLCKPKTKKYFQAYFQSFYQHQKKR